jgi:hypothetical protein
MYMQYILGLCQLRLSTADHVKFTLQQQSRRLTAAMFKPLMFFHRTTRLLEDITPHNYR